MSTTSNALTVEKFQPVRTEADSVHQQTLLGVEPSVLHPGNIYAIRTINGFQTLDLSKEDVLRRVGEMRRREVSSYTFHNLDSFVAYADRLFGGSAENDDQRQKTNGIYRRDQAICVADESAHRIRLIFDSQPDQWGDNIADLALEASLEAKRWHEASGRYMCQQDFAEFCEVNLNSFNSPAAATVLEIAQTFQAKTTVDFASAVRLSNGAFKLKREEKVEATAGERADLIIPEELRLALPLFKYGKVYEVRARLRYRIKEGSVWLSVLLVDPELAHEHAFREVVNECSSRLQMPLYWGQIATQL